LPTELPPFPDPESLRGAEERISRLMRRGRRYSPTADQSELTLRFDMELARQRSPSFDKCWREVDRLLSIICPKSAEDSAESQ